MGITIVEIQGGSITEVNQVTGTPVIVEQVTTQQQVQVYTKPTASALMGPKGDPGADGADGVDGVDGVDGADGADGVGVPAGGSTGSILAKATATDYDTAWIPNISVLAMPLYGLESTFQANKPHHTFQVSGGAVSITDGEEGRRYRIDTFNLSAPFTIVMTGAPGSSEVIQIPGGTTVTGGITFQVADKGLWDVYLKDTGSIWQLVVERVAQARVFTAEMWPITSGETLAIGDAVGGQPIFKVTPDIDGWRFDDVEIEIETAGTTGTHDWQIRRVRGGVAQDILTDPITIDSTETKSTDAATPPSINASYEIVQAGDLWYLDCDDVAATPGEGWLVISFTIKEF